MALSGGGARSALVCVGKVDATFHSRRIMLLKDVSADRYLMGPCRTAWIFFSTAAPLDGFLPPEFFFFFCLAPTFAAGNFVKCHNCLAVWFLETTKDVREWGRVVCVISRVSLSFSNENSHLHITRLVYVDFFFTHSRSTHRREFLTIFVCLKINLFKWRLICIFMQIRSWLERPLKWELNVDYNCRILVLINFNENEWEGRLRAVQQLDRDLSFHSIWNASKPIVLLELI